MIKKMNPLVSLGYE